MLEKLGDRLSNWARKYMPDPMIFAILLTILTYILGLIFTKTSWFGMILYWYKGFWVLLKFGMQMCVILVTGYALATTTPIQKFLRWLAGIPKTTAGAAMLVAIIAVIAGLINWGLGLIVGAIFAIAKYAIEKKQIAIRTHSWSNFCT